jgi:hypothetical protein
MNFDCRSALIVETLLMQVGCQTNLAAFGRGTRLISIFPHVFLRRVLSWFFRYGL